MKRFKLWLIRKLTDKDYMDLLDTCVEYKQQMEHYEGTDAGEVTKDLFEYFTMYLIAMNRIRDGEGFKRYKMKG